LPVVDKKGVLVGIITIDDLMDVGDEEATEDFHKLGALTAEREGFKVTNVFEASVRLLYQARIIWLMLLVVMSIFSGAAMSLFQKVITEHITLVFFLPVLIGSGGNAGSQSSTLMVRALSLGDVKVGDWFKMIGKEFLVSGSLGLTMGLGITAIGLMRGGFEIASVVGLSMLLIVINGSVIGMSMPFLFTKFKKDPATASGPLVASITDICGVLIYFGIAEWYLNLF